MSTTSKINGTMKDSNNDTIISVRDVGMSYQTKGGEATVLKNVTFDIVRGGFTILFGPSGSGKTTLLNIMNGLEAPTTGTVMMNGQDIYTATSDQRAYMRATSLGIVHQSNYWIKSLTVLENVAMPLFLGGSPKEAALLVAKESLERIDMGWAAQHMPATLSGGEQQRVSMARALAATPDIIFADEPTGNLDSQNGKLIIDLLTYLQRDFQRTVVLITHNIEYLPHGDKILFIKDGAVTELSGRTMTSDIRKSLKAQADILAKMERKAE